MANFCFVHSMNWKYFLCVISICKLDYLMDLFVGALASREPCKREWCPFRSCGCRNGVAQCVFAGWLKKGHAAHRTLQQNFLLNYAGATG